jgi:hypothetical protein
MQQQQSTTVAQEGLAAPVCDILEAHDQQIDSSLGLRLGSVLRPSALIVQCGL